MKRARGKTYWVIWGSRLKEYGHRIGVVYLYPTREKAREDAYFKDERPVKVRIVRVKLKKK